jgi:hypothetical protein
LRTNRPHSWGNRTECKVTLLCPNFCGLKVLCVFHSRLRTRTFPDACDQNRRAKLSHGARSSLQERWYREAQHETPVKVCEADPSRRCFMKPVVRTINLEDGMPTVAQARARLAGELQVARQQGVGVLKLVHGYGSTGFGGDLRIALQSTLRQMADNREIRACIFGENWRRSDDCAWQLLKRLPELKQDRDLDRGNRGITLVVL